MVGLQTGWLLWVKGALSTQLSVELRIVRSQLSSNPLITLQLPVLSATRHDQSHGIMNRFDESMHHTW